MTTPGTVNSAWYGLHIRSNFERTTASILEAKNLEVFCPTYLSRRRWSDRVKEIEMPLFPGYLFCRLNPHNRLPVLTTPGVVGIVGIGKIPTPIAEDEIGAVRKVVDSGLPARPWPFLRTGEKVAIERGPLAGAEGILLQVKSRYRIVVSIGLLQRSIAAELDVESVRAIQSSPSVPTLSSASFNRTALESLRA